MKLRLDLLRLIILTLSLNSFAADKFTIAILGDSLTEGYGVARDSAYPALLEKQLKTKNPEIRIVNAGVSGSTSAGGVSRLDWVLKSKPNLLIVALGANDGLRGLSHLEMKNNLVKIVRTAKDKHVKVVLLGMKMPPNYGPGFTKEFEKVFRDVAEAENVPLFPFMLDGIAGKPDLNLSDGIHPNEKGHQILAEKLFPFVAKQL